MATGFKTFSEWLTTKVEYTTYLESIQDLPDHSREFLLRESPHTRIKEVPDQRLSFLVGDIVDLGFENLGLSQAEQNELLQHFAGEGLRIPGTPYRLRYHGLFNYTVVELAQGNEPELPPHWSQAVLVMNNQDVFTWIGKRVRPPQLGTVVDFNKYRDVGDGWELIPG